jgi:hypothetical protein
MMRPLLKENVNSRNGLLLTIIKISAQSMLSIELTELPKASLIL